MSIIDGFTRQETIALAETTSNRLQYLEKKGLVIPHRIGKSSKPTVIYTWEQILEIRAISHLRQKQKVSLQTIRKIVKFLDESGFDDSLRNKKLVAIADSVFWVRSDWGDFPEKLPSALKVAGNEGKDVGQYILLVVPTLSEIVNDIWKAAERSQIIDFESFKERAKANSTRIA